ncbi:MAG TPA: alpha-L-arabinofuranosidase C-terminal domain-containing protein [Lacipirellula sp.]
MLRFSPLRILVIAAVLQSAAAGEQLQGKIVVDLSQPGPAFPRTMHGIFFEDINYAADGGLYAELIQNRSFEHRERMYAWRPAAPSEAIELVIADEAPLNDNNRHYLRVTAKQNGAAVANSGYDGISVKAGEEYNVSVYARSADGSSDFRVALVDQSGDSLGEVVLTGVMDKWQKLSGVITPSRDASDAQLQLQFQREGVYDVDMVSLFPAETFRGRKNGLRADLAQLLADLQPGFLRFPGGCIVEGSGLANAYRWKDTIGDVAQRKQNWNLWAERQSPQYHQTYGLGFFEYFQLCEDIGAEPLPVINCGMACQFRGGGLIPLEELDPWVQDALDLIEFANGPPTSPWGARRAAMGHPEPFNMKYLGIGNEQWSEEYFQRYRVFYRAIHPKYPELKLISTAGPQAEGDSFSYAWGRFATDTPADLVDEHYYRSPNWFLANHRRYDSYVRDGPKVFAGEFAAHTMGRRNNLEAALAEAAFMTGLWRNADVVDMACYAPLFARIGNVQWTPDLIWFDNDRSFGSPSYYVQQLYSKNLPELMAPATVDASPSKPQPLRGRIGVGTWRTQAEFKDIKVVSGDKTLYEWSPDKGLEDWAEHNGDWSSADGVLRQTSEAENVRLFTGETDWTDYTLSLKARKLAGAEGFLISFASTDPDTPVWWNLGGWNNTLHGLEMHGVTVMQRPGKIEQGRWYEIRIEVRGPKVSCYLDDELVQEYELKPHPSLYAAAGYNEPENELVLAVANPTRDAVETTIATKGRELAAEPGAAEVLAGDDPSLENSLDEPRRLAPERSSAELEGAERRYTFRPYSLTILKLKTE